MKIITNYWKSRRTRAGATRRGSGSSLMPPPFPLSIPTVPRCPRTSPSARSKICDKFLLIVLHMFPPEFWATIYIIVIGTVSSISIKIKIGAWKITSWKPLLAPRRRVKVAGFSFSLSLPLSLSQLCDIESEKPKKTSRGANFRIFSMAATSTFCVFLISFFFFY